MSKADLQAEAEALAGALGRAIEPGLSRAKLEALIAELRAESGAKATSGSSDIEEEEPTVPEAPRPKAIADAPERPQGGIPSSAKPKREPPKVAFYVAPGKATRVGTKIVGPFTPVKPSDFERGLADIDYLISRGVIVRGDLKRS